jgi:hypothetical protein
MPNSVEAATIFTLLIVPGYAFLSGYRLARSHTLPDRDLYVLAQAVIVSVLMVAVGWFRVEDFLHWIDDDTLGEHAGGALVLLLTLIAGPFLVARLLAAALSGLAKWGPTEGAIAFLGLAPANAWQRAWREPLSDGALVLIELEGDGSVLGQMTAGGYVNFPPREPAVYLPVAYRKEGDALTVMARGAYVPGEQIRAMYLQPLPAQAAGQPAGTS